MSGCVRVHMRPYLVPVPVPETGAWRLNKVSLRGWEDRAEDRRVDFADGAYWGSQHSEPIGT